MPPTEKTHTAEAKHTPTPWVHRPEINGVYANDPTGPQADGKARLMIADTQGQTWNGGLISEEECAANAAFIVTACNQHAALLASNAELVESLAELDALATGEGWNTPVFSAHFGASVRKARAALARAQALQTDASA